MSPSVSAEARPRACSATRSSTGSHGIEESSQVQLACTLATVLSPAAFASCQWRCARGPGPTTERLYSPTVTLAPARLMGIDHSLTDMSCTALGSLAMVSGAAASCHPQSHAITFALGLARWTPRSMTAFTSAMISAALRDLQVGQAAWLWWLAQLVKFSLAVMVKAPARPGTCLNTCSSESESHLRTSGCDVHIATWLPWRVPASS